MRVCLHFPRGMVDRTIRMKAYIPYVLRIPSSRTWMDLGTDYRLYRTVRTKAYILYVLCIPSGRMWMDLGTDYGVYFFVFKEWHHRNRNYGWLSTSDCVRFIPILCVRMARCYSQGMTTTIMYIIQLFIHKKTRLSTKIKNQMYNLWYLLLLLVTAGICWNLALVYCKSV